MIQKAKGTYDIYGETGRKVLYLEDILKSLMEKYNYEYLKTPMFESSSLFHRSVGETSDIVTKETYDFLDRGNRNMTLRPEGTAGIVRSYIENKMYARTIQPVKTWYFGPMFRYERPQSGRYREFCQFGVEVFGSTSPLMDAEVISIPVNFYKMLGLKGIKVNINTLGDKESRDNYRKALHEYFLPHINDLCEDCQKRYEKNPMRILDCKVDHESETIKNSPRIIDYLNEESKKHFEEVQKYLQAMDIEYEIDTNIVRGLDYYTHTVFEVEASVEGFGSQNVLCGGGRYNDLVESLEGPSTPGVGFALGLERLLTALDYENIKLIDDEAIDVYVIPFSNKENEQALSLTQSLRLNGFKVEMDYMERNLKSNFKNSIKLNSKYVIIIGEDEIKNNCVTIKKNSDFTSEKVKLDDLVEYLDENINR